MSAQGRSQARIAPERDSAEGSPARYRTATPRWAALAAVAALAACESFPTWDNPFTAPPVAVRLDERNTNAPISVVRNQTLVVTLEANITTGYRWEAVEGFAPVLTELPTPDYAVLSTGTAQAGAPGDMTFRFRAQNPGTTTLELAYRRPFEPNAPPAKTVRYDVTVR